MQLSHTYEINSHDRSFVINWKFFPQCGINFKFFKFYFPPNYKVSAVTSEIPLVFYFDKNLTSFVVVPLSVHGARPTSLSDPNFLSAALSIVSPIISEISQLLPLTSTLKNWDWITRTFWECWSPNIKSSSSRIYLGKHSHWYSRVILRPRGPSVLATYK